MCCYTFQIELNEGINRMTLCVALVKANGWATLMRFLNDISLWFMFITGFLMTLWIKNIFVMEIVKLLFVIMFFNGHCWSDSEEICTWAEELITFNLLFIEKKRPFFSKARSNRDILLTAVKFYGIINDGMSIIHAWILLWSCSLNISLSNIFLNLYYIKWDFQTIKIMNLKCAGFESYCWILF